MSPEEILQEFEKDETTHDERLEMPEQILNRPIEKTVDGICFT